MCKKIVSVLLSALIVTSCVSVFSVSAEEKNDDVKQIRQVNHNNLTAYYDESGNEIDITTLNNDVDVNENSLPEKYDLRDYGRVTSVKNQGSEGLCWDFAATASIESNVLSQTELSSKLGENPYKNLDLSEGGNSWYIHTNIDDESSELYGDFINEPSKGAQGGHAGYVAEGLSSGYGTYPESLMPYENWNTGYPEALRNYSDYRLKDYSELSKDTALVKKSIMNTGAVAVNYNCFHANTYMVDGMEAYYDNGEPIDGVTDQGHVVAIIGWDDDFSRENFNPEMRPQNDGAWLCKNSWGEDYCSTAEGYKGLFWMSYETNVYTFSSFEMQSVDEFDNIYQHQITSDNSSDVMSAANIFKAESDQKLEQVCFAANGASDINIEVFRLNENYTSPKDGQSLADFDISTDFTGIHSIDCPDGITLKSGDEFSVVITKNSKLQLKFKSDNNNDVPGLSFFCDDSGEWKDVADDSYYSYASIKAYTSNIGKSDFSKLQKLVDDAENVTPDEGVDSDTIEELKTRIKSAKAILSDENAGQNSVDNEYCLLKNTLDKITNYVFNINNADDYSKLYNLIEVKKDSKIKKIVINEDIDFKGNYIFPIFTYSDFSVVIEGNNHTLSNFLIDGGSTEACSLFGNLNKSKILNLNISDFSIHSTSSACAVASRVNNTTIQNCSIRNAKIKAEIQASVLFTSASDSTIENCSIENVKVYGNNAADLYSSYSNETVINDCTSKSFELYSQNLIGNGKLTVSAYPSQMNYNFFPIITLTDEGCKIESFVGKIISAKAGDDIIENDNGIFKVNADGGDHYVELTYEIPDNNDYCVSGDLETHELSLTAYIGDKKELEIPSELYGYKITGFDRFFGNSISYRDSITAITIPGTIKQVDSGLFDEMPSLEKLTLCDGIEKICGTAFWKCENLSELVLPDSMKTIGESAFSGCSSLNKVEFNEGLKEIGLSAFANCRSLDDLILPDSLEIIEDAAFAGCRFTSVTLGKNIKEIQNSTFGSTAKTEIDYNLVLIPNFVINGYAGTAAEDYADRYGFKFVDLSTSERVVTGERFDYDIFMKGDVNLDGEVNIADATLIQKWLAETVELSPVQRYNAIVCDAFSKIDVNNATDIQKYLSDIISTLEEHSLG